MKFPLKRIGNSIEVLGSLTGDSGFCLAGVLRPSVSGQQNDWSPTGLVDEGMTAAAVIIPVLTGNVIITGLYAAQVDGTQIYLYNGTDFEIRLLDDHAASTAANRFSLSRPTVSLYKGDGVLAIYDGAAQRFLAFRVDRATDVQVFTSSGTWTKPDDAQSVHVYLLAGGGGGGSGCKGAAGTLRRGGGGGGGGAASEMMFSAATLADTVSVTVGAGGAGGPGGNFASGNPGTAGGDSSFGSFLIAKGGLGGPGGTSSALDAGATAMQGLLSDGAPETLSSTTGGTGAKGSASRFAGAAGGSGGGISTANATAAGGAGGDLATCINLTTTGGAGGAAGANGSAGSNPLSHHAGTGAGGGGSSATAPGRGGKGGRACGGGGSGATTTGTTQSGGTGGAGIVVVTTYR